MTRTVFTALVALLIIFIIPWATTAQEYEGPLLSNNVVAASCQSALPKVARKTTATQSLPFFENFSGKGIFPDSSKWTDFCVYVNNTMGVHVIDKGVATFDDLNSMGLPYDSFSNTAFRYADTLTSQPIDLDPATNLPEDSIYMSFFYQPQGNGFFPLPQDSLMLFMKTRYGGYIKVWSVPGSNLQRFQQVMIPISDTLFFDKSFQFRFINIAGHNWADAIWNIDYIRIFKGRSMYDTFIQDIALTSDPTYLLNDYTSMPYRQFKANPAAETAPQYSDTVSNLNMAPGSYSITHSFIATAITTGAVLQPPLSYTTTLTPGARQQLRYSAYTATVPSSAVGLRDRVVFENKYYLDSTAVTGTTLNDTAIREQIFDNYLAYDDGTAEKSYYLNLLPTLPGKVAIEHHLNIPDTLRGMAIYFGRQIPFATYKEFSMVIYATLNGVNGAVGDNVLYTQELSYPGYADTVNHFWIYKFDKPLPLPAGTFYAGTLQPADRGSDSLYFGLDVNRVGSSHTFFNVLGGWTPSRISGALMMRPLLGQDITGTKVNEIALPQHKWQIAPNPASNVLRLGNDGDRNGHYRILDMQGRVLLQGAAIGGMTIDISSLAPGLYMTSIVSGEDILAPQKFIKL